MDPAIAIQVTFQLSRVFSKEPESEVRMCSGYNLSLQFFPIIGFRDWLILVSSQEEPIVELRGYIVLVFVINTYSLKSIVVVRVVQVQYFVVFELIFLLNPSTRSSSEVTIPRAYSRQDDKGIVVDIPSSFYEFYRKSNPYLSNSFAQEVLDFLFELSVCFWAR